MIQGGRPDADRPLETEAQPGGIRVKFADPEGFRAYINEPLIAPKQSFAERLAGMVETDLGTYNLDGQLFDFVKFSLITETNRDLERRSPAAIIRADLELGGLVRDDLSGIQDEQIRLLHQYFRLDPEESQSWLEKFSSRMPNGIDDLTHYVPWTSNVARVYPSSVDANDPMVVFQIWDKDVDSSVSLSLVSYGRYYTQWSEKHNFYNKQKDDGLEVSMADVDSWRFSGRVGIDARNPDDFKRSLEFYEHWFSVVIGEIYKSEGLAVPDLLINLELPFAKSAVEGVTFDEIGGQRSAVNYMKGVVQNERGQILMNPLQPPVLLIGDTGNGKTSLALALATELGIQPVVKEPSGLAPSAGADEIVNFLESAYMEAKLIGARTNFKGVLIFKQLALILGDNERVHESFKGMLEKWKQERHVLIVGTASSGAFAAPLGNMFDVVDVSNLDTVAQRKEILAIHARKLGRTLGRDVFAGVDFDRVARLATKPTGRDIVKFLNLVYRQHQLETGQGIPAQITTEYIISKMLLP